jgi:hypothetical protein
MGGCERLPVVGSHFEVQRYADMGTIQDSEKEIEIRKQKIQKIKLNMIGKVYPEFGVLQEKLVASQNELDFWFKVKAVQELKDLN